MNIDGFIETHKKVSDAYLNELYKHKMKNPSEIEFNMDANIVNKFNAINMLLLDESFCENLFEKMSLEELCKFEETLETTKNKAIEILKENPQFRNYQDIKKIIVL